VCGCAHQVFEVLAHQDDRLVLHCLLPDGADGFPGEIALRLTYQLDDTRGLIVAWQARVARAATVCSFTSHLYFNLSGQGGLAPITDHCLQMPAEQVLALDAQRLPTGRLLPVAGGPLDWRTARPVGSTHFDHYWVTAIAPGPLAWQARVASPRSGLALSVWSTEPGLQFYAGGSLGRPAGIQVGPWGDQHGRPLVPGAGLCLEPSGYPDAPSHPHFPNPWVAPGETRAGRIEYRLTRS
jgi:aldose 1-epimerase